MSIISYRDLRVWQAGIDLVEQVYRVTLEFPRREMFGLASQMQRAAVSIPSNIAEGHIRQHSREYLQHVAIAHGSLAELQTQEGASADPAARMAARREVRQWYLARRRAVLMGKPLPD